MAIKVTRSVTAFDWWSARQSCKTSEWKSQWSSCTASSTACSFISSCSRSHFFPLYYNQCKNKRLTRMNAGMWLPATGGREGRQYLSHSQSSWIVFWPDCWNFPLRAYLTCGAGQLQGPSRCKKNNPHGGRGVWRGVEDRIQKPNWENQAGYAGCGSGGTTEIKV